MTRYGLYGTLILGAAQAFAGTPTVVGTSGYINMPNASVEADGTMSAGFSYDRPYSSIWTSASILPFLQLSGRYVTFRGLDNLADPNDPNWRNYGDYKDKVFGAKLRLVEESALLPALAVGTTDMLGTGLFRGNYAVASKTFGERSKLELSLGYGNGRTDGAFGGLRWSPHQVPGLSLVAEYDAHDYRRDFGAERTGLTGRGKGPAAGIEYRWGWLGAQVARHRDHFSANAYVSIPFSQREFIPKLAEPRAFQQKDAPARVGLSAWQNDPAHAAALAKALARQNYRNIRIDLDAGVLRLALTNARISELGRAVGRAARTALAFAPEGTRSIHVVYTTMEQPVATYEFFDLARLSDYLSGLVDRDAFLQTVLVRYARPADLLRDDRQGMLAGLRERVSGAVVLGEDGEIAQYKYEDQESNRFRTVPKLSFFFNDPSGALRYEVWAGINFDRRLGQGLYLNSALKLNLFENVSDVTQPSNSLLPHVRTDIADYKRGGRFKLNRLLLNQYLQPSERVYARLSAGFYEEMYRGVGGQVLYLPRDSRWAADIAVDALHQRGVKGWFDTRDYRTVTALGSLHYRLPYDVTATARAGRFLARDEGVRLEFKRRFRSGFEMGVWYTRTNGNDITNPGAPGNPYHDKGIFLSIPLNIMLLADTQSSAGFALAPWTRDVGQSVASPRDLYDMLEQPRRDMTAYDGLGNFAERKDEQTLDAVSRPVRPMANPWPAFRLRLRQAASSAPDYPEWLQGAALAGGMVALGAALDKPADRLIVRHQGGSLVRGYGNVGKLAPILLTGAAGAAVAFGDPRLENTGFIALQSVAASGLLSAATKRIVNRARPNEELGSWARSSKRSDSSFPSNHSAIAFAAVTPFAQEYDAPWLYGVAALGSLGRVADRKHWVSDTVAGAAVGYALGSWLWQAQRGNTRSWLSVSPEQNGIRASWSANY